MNIYIDVETLPCLAADARTQVIESLKPPGTLKKPESIAAWWRDEAPAAAEEAYRKQALDAAYGELCAVGYADDDSEPVSLVRALYESESDFIRRALGGLSDIIHKGGVTAPDGFAIPDEPYFVGHNTPFDLGFLMRRCWVQGIRPSFRIPLPSARDGKDYGDTMTLWAGYRGTISLDRLCRALGMNSPKAGMDGSQVYDCWLAGQHDLVAAYNRADVFATRECWWRMNQSSTTGVARPGRVPCSAQLSVYCKGARSESND